MPLGQGETFADYTIVRRLGGGGMGEVYLAQHPRLPRQDALKLLNTSISTDPTFRQRFLREADLAARLWHPNIVSVHDRGEDDGRLWIAMDFVDGTDAAELLSTKFPAGMPQHLVVAVVTAVASALDYAHAQGLLHRDVKPANIMISDLDDEAQRRIMLTDFGIARELDDAAGLTATNMTLGTVAYSAPEQLMGESVDGRADQYALAATAYHLLAGTPPFAQSSPAAVIGAHLKSRPPRLSSKRPEFAPLDDVLNRALAKDPQDRFGRCGDFARALAEAADTIAAEVSPQAPTMAAPVPAPSPAAKRDIPVVTDIPAPPTASAPLSGLRPGAVLAGVAIVLGVLLAGALGLLWGRGGGSSSTTTSSPAHASSVAGSLAAPSTVTVSVPPPSTVTKTVIPAPPTTETSDQTSETGWQAIIAGTCDEGGSCGVQQRTAPLNAAPKRYPEVLKDGAQVVVLCRTTGDVRSSAGHGSSRVWWQLANGSYINAVYTNLDPHGIPEC